VAWTRNQHLGTLAAGQAFDVLVVGGGITGCGAALDLASRGLRVAVVERHDFAAGTSSRSTKLFHGGIRYLPQFEFSLVAEGLREQRVLAEIADYLFLPLEFLIPVYRQHGLADAPAWAAKGRRARWALGAGLTLYDLLGGKDRPGRHHRRVTPEEAEALVPRLRTDGLRSGFVYSDAQTDDARLVMAVARTAVEQFQAVAVNHVEAIRLTRSGDRFRVRLRDGLGGEEFEVGTRTVLAATGAFPAPTVEGARTLQMVSSKGVHLLARAADLGLLDHAVVLPETEDGRVLFIIPWQGHALIGTTDTAYDGSLSHPRADASDVDYLLRHVHRFLDVDDFTPLASFTGLRALAGSKGGTTAAVSREHVIRSPLPGYVQVAGGKLTTYRRIAGQAAQMVARHLGLRGKSTTDQIPLVGSGAVLPPGSTVPAAAIGRYGGEAGAIADLVDERPDLGAQLGDGRTRLAEVVHAARNEAAATIADFTLRRTRLAWMTPDHGRGDQAAVGRVLGAELGWSEAQVATQIAAHESELEAEGL
jgi:glycerol-3-phosphate dehydrogenase